MTDLRLPALLAAALLAQGCRGPSYTVAELGHPEFAAALGAETRFHRPDPEQLGGIDAYPAETVDDAPTKSVKVWDLDLAKASDVQTLYERVQQAANDVCRDEAQRYRRGTRRAAPLGWRERCVNDAIDEAVNDVGNRRLAALHTPASRLF